MPIQLLAYAVCLAFIVLLGADVSYRAFDETLNRPGARTFGFLMLSISEWAAFHLVEILFSAPEIKIIARKFAYLGTVLIVPLWLAFSFKYTHSNYWWAGRGRAFIFGIPSLLMFLLGLTNESHFLVWKSLQVPATGYGALTVEYGYAFWIYAAFSYLCTIWGLGLYIFNYFKASRLFRKQTVLMIAATLTAVLGNVLHLNNIPNAAMDITLLSFIIAVPLMSIGFFRFGVLNLIPIAAPTIINNLSDAIIVTDNTDRVININPAGRKWIGANQNVTGKTVFEILSDPGPVRAAWNMPNARVLIHEEHIPSPTWFEVSIIHLGDEPKSPLGRVLVAHDITQERGLLEIEKRRAAQLGLLEEVGRQIANSIDKKAIIQMTIDAVVGRFGYAEAAISLLTEDNALEIAGIGGTQDFGYKPGFRQEIGTGIIGHVALTRTTHITNNTSEDPYYFSNIKQPGSAIGIPIMNENELLGVLYVESNVINGFSDENDAQMLQAIATQVAASLQRARLYDRIQEQLRVITTVQSISHITSSSLDLDEIFRTTVNVLKEKLGYRYISIYLFDGEYLHLGAQMGYPEESIIPRIHKSQGIVGETVASKKPIFIPDVSSRPNFLRADEKVTSEICVPLLKENTVLGTLNVEADSTISLTNIDLELLTTLASPLALAIEHARLHSKMKLIAMTDAVTGLSNRHSFETQLKVEVENAGMNSTPLSLIIFDIDSFKEYNDTWGHPAGDERLKATGNILLANIRKNDIAARYGGDEFAVILPNTDRSSAMQLAKRLLDAARAGAPIQSKHVKQSPGYTLSIGIATFPEDADTLETLLLAADRAELIAKQLGKNRIVSASDSNEQRT